MGTGEGAVAAAAPASGGGKKKGKKKGGKKKGGNDAGDEDLDALLAEMGIDENGQAGKGKKGGKGKGGSGTSGGAGAEATGVIDGAAPPPPGGYPGIDLSGENKEPHARCLKPGSRCDSFTKYKQTWPPSRPVADVFAKGDFPEGEILEYTGTGNRERMKAAEFREREKLQVDTYSNVRRAAEVHREVRKWAQSWIKPGIRLADMCELIENKVRELVQERGLEAGMGFPTGCSLDHVAAHYTPNPGDEVTLDHGNVMKIDFGVQVE